VAISIDWGTKVISISKADMILLQTDPIEIYQLDLNDFRLQLKALEQTNEGMAALKTHNHSAPISVGGATLARVVELINGYSVTFENGSYAVNAVGANSNISDVLNLNTVQLRTANSAGLQDLNSLQAASYAGGVAVNINSNYSGQLFPVGTRGYPVNNLHDAHEIAEARGLNTFYVISSMEISAETLADGYVFRGDNPSLVTLTINDSAEVSNCIFENVTVQGVLDNFNVLRNCVVNDVTHINGVVYDCMMEGTTTLSGVGEAAFLNCSSGIAGSVSHPIIDWAPGATTNLLVRNWNGGLGLQSCAESSVVSSLDFSAGSLTVYSSMAAGTHGVRGSCSVTVQPGVAATINDNTDTHRLDVMPASVWNHTQ